MSIRDQGYQRYQGERRPHAQRWTVVFRHTLRTSIKQPWVLAMMFSSIVPLLIVGVWMYIKVKIWATMPAEAQSQGAFEDPAFLVFHYFTSWWGTTVPAFLIAMFAGGATIADDLRMNAFQFYFARPLAREQYLAGKVMAVLVVVWMACFFPPLLLSIERVSLIVPEHDKVLRLAALPFEALALSLVQAVALTVPAVALSSLSRRRGLVQGGFAAVFLLPWILGAIVGAILRSAWPNILSLPSLLEGIGAQMFGYTPGPDERMLAWLPAVAAIVVTVAVAAGLLRWRLSSVEVVAG